MSDQAVISAPAPIVEAPAAPAAPAVPMTRDAARAALSAMPVAAPATPAGETPLVDGTGRFHAPVNGRFIEKPAGEQAQDPAAPAEATAEPPADGAAAPVAGEEATNEQKGGSLPDGFVRLEVPADDPLRAQGHEYVPVPAGMEDVFKNLLNRPVKRKELDSARSRATELEAEVDRHAAALRATNEFNALLFSDRRIFDTFFTIAEEHGEDAAGNWLQGLVNSNGEKVNEYVSEAQVARQEAQNKAAAETFLADVVTVRSAFPYLSDQEWQQTLGIYASAAAVNGSSLDVEDFKKTARKLHLDHPKVQEQLQQLRREREAARQQQDAGRATAEAKERADLERVRQVNNPLSGLHSATGTGQEPAPPASRPLTRDEARRNL